ncbi:disease resistance protein Pik-2-like [Carex rostrata]
MEAAAIGTAKSALNSVVQTATTAITNEIGLVLGVQEELFFIKEELQMMRSFLRAAKTENMKDEIVITWINQVEELAFDVEDCLQEASVHLMKKSCLRKTCSLKKRDDIARKILVLKTRIEDVSKRNKRYSLINNDNGNHTSNQSASTGSIANVDAVLVGLDEPKRKLVELILKEDGEVISVVGMGGLGKTTLVREVYGCPELRNKFKYFFWVTVLHPFNMEEFIESLANQIDAQEVDNKGKKMEGNRIKPELLPKKTIKEKKEEVIRYLKDNMCLIVLDDLSSVSEWDRIKPILPTGNGSRIIVTTRNRNPLAESITHPSDNIYDIKELSEKDAFDLFCKTVYKTPNYCLVSNEGPSSTEITEENSKGQNECMANIITEEEDREMKDDPPHEGKCNMKNGSSSTEIMEENIKVQNQCVTNTIIEGEDREMKDDLLNKSKCNTEDGSSTTEITQQNSEVQKQCIAKYPITEDMKTQADLIIKRCERLPLAIVTIGSYLATKPNKTSHEWKTLNDRLSSELAKNPKLGVVNTVLTSSYDGLPHQLKPSLLYLSVFHNHKEIRRSRIIRRWMADGYVMESRKTMPAHIGDVGNDYFNDLMGRSLIQPSQMNTIVNGDVKKCNIHDMMYELIHTKAVDENMVSVLEDENLITMTDKVRHLVITGGPCTRDKVLERVKLSHLRSISIFGEVMRDYLRYPRMKLLRVLDLEGTLGLKNRDLKNVGKLRLLRYLGLRGTDITKLPDSLGKLSELETLDIKNTDVVRLPTGLTKLHKLIYLCAGDSYDGVRVPRGIGALRSLNILGTIDIGRSKGLAKEMQYLTNLTKLAVTGFLVENADALAKVIDRLKHLRSLLLEAEFEYEDNSCSILGHCVNSISDNSQPSYLQSLGSCLDSVCFPYTCNTSRGLRRCLDSVSSPPKYLQSLKLYSTLHKLPDWISSLENLEKIHFSFTRLKEIKAIEKLSNLKSLKMTYVPIEEMLELCFGKDTFPMLQVMILEDVTDLKSVSIEETALKRLEQLKIIECSGIIRQGRVSGLEFLVQLKEMEVKVHERTESESESNKIFVSNLQEQLNKLPQKPVLRVSKS